MVRISAFDIPIEQMKNKNITPLLYQSGYITITCYDENNQLYSLDIPNKEVRLGLMENLLDAYLEVSNEEAGTAISLMSVPLRENNLEEFFKQLRTFLSTIPYCENTDYEGHYQQVFYIIFSLLGYYADVEVRTPQGRVDVVLRTKTHLYVMELKLNQSAERALNQIDIKNYPERFALCGLPIVKVGINFDKESHTLSDWSIRKIE